MSSPTASKGKISENLPFDISLANMTIRYLSENSMVYEGPETPTEWKSESVTNLWTDQLTGLGARDAYASKNGKI